VWIAHPFHSAIPAATSISTPRNKFIPSTFLLNYCSFHITRAAQAASAPPQVV
jgi:hypothetical protein